jgi:hypothetical protein
MHDIVSLSPRAPLIGGLAWCFCYLLVGVMASIDMSGASLGDFNPRDVAQTINHIYAQLGDVLRMLENDIAAHETRIAGLETWQSRYTDEKKSLTALLIGARNEARTISDVHKLLKEQIDAERNERAHRRKHLDSTLTAVFALGAANLLLHVYRVLRRPGQLAQP